MGKGLICKILNFIPSSEHQLTDKTDLQDLQTSFQSVDFCEDWRVLNTNF